MIRRIQREAFSAVFVKDSAFGKYNSLLTVSDLANEHWDDHSLVLLFSSYTY